MRFPLLVAVSGLAWTIYALATSAGSLPWVVAGFTVAAAGALALTPRPRRLTTLVLLWIGAMAAGVAITLGAEVSPVAVGAGVLYGTIAYALLIFPPFVLNALIAQAQGSDADTPAE